MPEAPLGTLRQFKDDHCPMCGGTLVTIEYCDACLPGRQVRGNPRTLFDVTTHGDKPFPHLHKTCNHCRYEWLSETRPATRAEGAAV
jgi:hypothetical protein